MKTDPAKPEPQKCGNCKHFVCPIPFKVKSLRPQHNAWCARLGISTSAELRRCGGDEWEP
jgi:hypothetical protein